MSQPNASLLMELFDAVATELLNRAKTGDASAADLGVAVKMLKDNSITAVIEDNEKLQGLRDTIAARRAKGVKDRQNGNMLEGVIPITAAERDEAIELAKQSMQ